MTECVKSSVFNLCFNTGSNADDVAKGGKLFQTPDTATGNARLPTVECIYCGMTSATILLIEANVENLSVTQLSSAQRYSGAIPCWQRKASNTRWCIILSGTRSNEGHAVTDTWSYVDQSNSVKYHRMKSIDQCIRHTATGKGRTYTIQMRQAHWIDQRLVNWFGNWSTNAADQTQHSTQLKTV